MTDSTADKNARDGGFEAGPSADELFGEIEESVEGGSADREADGASPDDDAIEDRTAADVFDQLRTDVGDDTDDVLADESPEDIIASADDPGAETTVDDDLLMDEDALEDLLLTGRTKEKEFLWVDSGDEDGGSDAEATGAIDASETTDAADQPSEGTVEADEPGDAEVESPATDSDGDSSESSPSGGSILVSDEDRAGPTDGFSSDAPPSSSGDEDSKPGVAADDDVKHALGDEDEADAESTSDPEVDETTPDAAADDADETSLVVQDDEQSLATPEDEGSSGFLGWLRSKLGGLF